MKEQNDNIFKIIDTRTGLYSTGGTWPTFTKKGKAWTKIGHVKAHLSQFEAIPDTWEIVEIEQRVCSSKLALDSFKAPEPGKTYGRTKLRPELFGQTPGPTLYGAKGAGPSGSVLQGIPPVPMSIQQAAMQARLINGGASAIAQMNSILKVIGVPPMPANALYPMPIIKRMKIQKNRKP